MTIVWHLFKKHVFRSVPLTFIGDMPRRLLSFEEWSARKVAWNDVKCGDLLFVKNRNRPKLIAHIALVLNANQIFHCCSARGAVIETKEQFFDVYEQKLPFEKMPLYIDPRNRSLRDKHQGLFTPV